MGTTGRRAQASVGRSEVTADAYSAAGNIVGAQMGGAGVKSQGRVNSNARRIDTPLVLGNKWDECR